MKERKKNVDTTNLDKTRIRSGDSQFMVPIASYDEKQRKPILPLEVLRKVAATVKAIKKRLASVQGNIIPEQIEGAPHEGTGTGEDQSGQPSSSDSGKNLEDEP
jgi:hypothetical protein